MMNKSKKNYFIRLTISSVILYLVLRSIDVTDIKLTLRSVDIRLLAFAVLLYFPGQLISAFRWRYILNTLRRYTPFLTVLLHNTRGQISALLLPGQISGDIVRAISISHGESGKSIYFLSIVIDKLSFFIAVASFFTLGKIAKGPIADFKGIYWVTIVLILICVMLLLIFCGYRNREYITKILLILKRLPVFKDSMKGINNWPTIPRISPKTIIIILVLAYGFQFINALGSYILARSMQIQIDLIDWAAINAFVALIQILPITIAGLGVREGLLAAILTLYGIPISQSVSVSLLGFFIVSLLIAMTWIMMELIQLFTSKGINVNSVTTNYPNKK